LAQYAGDIQAGLAGHGRVLLQLLCTVKRKALYEPTSLRGPLTVVRRLQQHTRTVKNFFMMIHSLAIQADRLAEVVPAQEVAGN